MGVDHRSGELKKGHGMLPDREETMTQEVITKGFEGPRAGRGRGVGGVELSVEREIREGGRGRRRR